MTNTITENSVKTKHARLTQELRQRIREGELRPGDQLPSFSEFREQHGVTLSTIEKSLSTLEREGLIERFHGKGVFVRQKRRPSTKCLGFLGLKQGTSAWDLYWVQFMAGLQSGAHSAGYHVLLVHPELSSSWQDKVDGVIVHETTPMQSAKNQLPFARVNVHSMVPGLSSVVADEYGGAYQAVQHLLELGHRRIAYLVDDSYWQTQIRITGYRVALRDAGIEAGSDWVRCSVDESRGKHFADWGKSQMQNWLDSDWQKLGCTALLCHNDEVAMGVLETLQQQKIKVPEDLSVMGYDGTILCETARPKLTSIKVPSREIGFRAATLLIEQIELGQTDAVTLTLPTTLQLRGSTSRLTNVTS